MGTELQSWDTFNIDLTEEVKVNDNAQIASVCMPVLLTTAYLQMYADLKQQQIGELDGHGNVILTMGSNVFAGKQSTKPGWTSQMGQYVAFMVDS